jgi:hypothetical protein
MRRRGERRGYNAIIKLKYPEIIYDVDFISWKVAQSHVSDNPVMQAEMSTDKESSDWASREIDTAVENAKSQISAYVVDDSRMSTDDIDNPNEWDIVLQMEEDWKGSIKRMTMYLHKYVVNYVLSEWFMMVKPDESPAYTASAEAALDGLLSEARVGVVENVFFNI